MKLFTNKNITQKIIIAVLIVILCNFIFPTYSRADIGGMLFDPMADLVCSIADVVLSALQVFFYEDNSTMANIMSSLSNAFAKNYEDVPDMAYTRLY